MKWEKENNRIESMNMTTTMISAILEMVQSSLDLSLEAQGYVRIHDELEVRTYKKIVHHVLHLFLSQFKFKIAISIILNHWNQLFKSYDS